MNSENILQLLSKINDLKNLFTTQQQIIPLLEDLFTFLEDIIPLSEELVNSLAESTAKMPFATHQLDNVNQTTEMAITEILSLLEEMMGKIETMSESIQTHGEKLQHYFKLEDKLTTLLKKSIDKHDTQFWEQFKILQKEKKQILDAFIANNDSLIQTLGFLNEQANNIMLALQIQDITSQQIASVNHILINIKRRLENLLNHFGKEASPVEEIKFDGNNTFDPHARFDPSGQKQQVADEIINTVLNQDNQPNSSPTSNQQISASDIDALFGTAPNVLNDEHDNTNPKNNGELSPPTSQQGS